jgi:hypothetical protein
MMRYNKGEVANRGEQEGGSNMAVPEVQFKELVKRVEHLERGLDRLEIVLGRKVAPEAQVSLEGLSEKERGLAALRRSGLLVDPSPYTRALAEAWHKRPREERERIQAELRALRLDPLLSEIIVQNRR